MSSPIALIPLSDVLVHTPRPVYPENGRMYRQIGIRSHGRGIFHKPESSALEIGDKRVFEIAPGDFVLNIVFAWEGAVGVVGEGERGMIASHRFPTFRAVSSRLDVRWLLHYFRTRAGLEQLDRVSPGGAGRNRTLNRSAFLALRVPLPIIEEQERVVAGIEEVECQLVEARALRALSATEVQAMWQRGAERIFNRLADRHPTRSLREVIVMRGGGTPSKADPTYWGGSIPWITPKDMKLRELDGATVHISERAVRETSAKLIPVGAVLVVVRGMILARTVPVAVLRTSAAINQDMKALVPSSEVLSEYLSAFLWALNPSILDLVEKSTHDTRKLGTARLLSLGIPLPPHSDQRGVVAELDALLAGVASVERLQDETSAELDALLPAVLNRAFTGGQ